MAFREQSIDAFMQELSSKAPIPGGGGASALVGALCAALTHMVASLTVGKPKYAAVEAEMNEVLHRRLVSTIDENRDLRGPKLPCLCHFKARHSPEGNRQSPARHRPA